MFLEKQAKRLGLTYHVTEMVKGKPIFIMTWPGLEPELPSLLLNSHTDVVPVFEEFWKHDPFAAVKEENGDIYGRGTQDMKSVGIQHIEAIYQLKVVQKKRFKRTIGPQNILNSPMLSRLVITHRIFEAQKWFQRKGENIRWSKIQLTQNIMNLSRQVFFRVNLIQ